MANPANPANPATTRSVTGHSVALAPGLVAALANDIANELANLAT